jgi:hypothetical protein
VRLGAALAVVETAIVRGAVRATGVGAIVVEIVVSVVVVNVPTGAVVVAGAAVVRGAARGVARGLVLAAEVGAAAVEFDAGGVIVTDPPEEVDPLAGRAVEGRVPAASGVWVLKLNSATSPATVPVSDSSTRFMTIPRSERERRGVDVSARCPARRSPAATLGGAGRRPRPVPLVRDQRGARSSPVALKRL